MIHVGIDLQYDNMFNSAINDNGEQIEELPHFLGKSEAQLHGVLLSVG